MLKNEALRKIYGCTYNSKKRLITFIGKELIKVFQDVLMSDYEWSLTQFKRTSRMLSSHMNRIFRRNSQPFNNFFYQFQKRNYLKSCKQIKHDLFINSIYSEYFFYYKIGKAPLASAEAINFALNKFLSSSIILQFTLLVFNILIIAINVC